MMGRISAVRRRSHARSLRATADKPTRRPARRPDHQRSRPTIEHRLKSPRDLRRSGTGTGTSPPRGHFAPGRADSSGWPNSGAGRRLSQLRGAFGPGMLRLSARAVPARDGPAIPMWAGLPPPHPGPTLAPDHPRRRLTNTASVNNVVMGPLVAWTGRIRSGSRAAK